MNYMTGTFPKPGFYFVAAESPSRLANGLTARLGEEKVASELTRSGSDLAFFRNGKQHFNSAELWPLLRVALQTQATDLLVDNNLPVPPYDLNRDVHLTKPPLLWTQEIPPVRLVDDPKTIAGLPVDFALGIGASIFSSNAAFIRYYAARGFDILTYKTVRSKPHDAHPLPRLAFLADETQVDPLLSSTILTARSGYWPSNIAHASMANSFGIPSLSPEEWKEDLREARNVVREGHQILITSVMSSVVGGSLSEIADDFIETALLAKSVGTDIIELNLSCPNTSEAAGILYTNINDCKTVVERVRAGLGTNTRIFAKIGYLPLERLTRFVHEIGPHVDGLVAINTMSAKVVGPDNEQFFPRTPSTGREEAGISGWMINERAHEVAVNLVRLRDEFAKQIGKYLYLLGLGGVMTKDDFDKRLATGVDAVSSVTGAFVNQLLGCEIRGAESIAPSTPSASYKRTEKEPSSTATGAALKASPVSGALASLPVSEEEKLVTSSSTKRDFRGVVIRRDPDGYGIVEFDSSEKQESELGFFTKEVLQNPVIARACTKGRRVKGRAERRTSLGGFRILRLEPTD